MRRLLLSLVLLATPLPLAHGAEPTELFDKLDTDHSGKLEAAEIPAPQRRLFDRLVRTTDADEDGQLSREEFAAGLEPAGPSKVLVEKQGSALPGSDALLLLLAKLDANADGTIREEEVPAELKGIFQRIEERLGGEPDGVLDRRELTRIGPRLAPIALRFAQRMDLDVELELALLPEKQWQAVQTMMEPPRRGDALSDPEQARQLFRRLDADGDGQLTLEEIPEPFAERLEQLLERGDRNQDGKLSEAELLKFSQRLQNLNQNRMSPTEVRTGIDRLLKQFDRNGDQQLSSQELPRRMANRFERVDRDGNGQLTREELGPVVEILNRARRDERRPEMWPAEAPEPMMETE